MNGGWEMVDGKAAERTAAALRRSGRRTLSRCGVFRMGISDFRILGLRNLGIWIWVLDLDLIVG